MAKCAICDKGSIFGIQVSHAHNRNNKQWKPNIRNVKAVINGQAKKIKVCSSCLRSGKVERAH